MPFDIVWNDVTLQDQTELAKAALNNAQAELIQVQTEKLRKEI